MREIKFRVWDKKEKKYLYPESQSFIIVPTKPSFGVTLPYENCSNPGNIDEDCFDWADADLLFGRYELEQYTGLKDKNGKEIYEGDILRLYDRFVSVITWDTAAASFQWFATDGDGYCRLSELDKDYYEIIGNIHENGELLGGKE